jgi:exodeoxyribonuclease V alpha subunit
MPDEPRRPWRPVAQSRSQQALNPPGELRVERFGSTYGIGDKVMQVENDYDKEVYNGDLGVVRSIDPEASEMVMDGGLADIVAGPFFAIKSIPSF